ncbi:MAG: hypothetical protein ACK5QX_04675 [bacterium]
MVQKHRKQFNVLDAALRRAFDLTDVKAKQIEVFVLDWRTIDFVRSPVSKATSEAGRER